MAKWNASIATRQITRNMGVTILSVKNLVKEQNFAKGMANSL